MSVANESADSPNCVYICSAAHCGSTLLDLLLGSHSRVASLGEISQLPKNVALNTRCTCGEPVRSCSLWSEIITVMGESLGLDLDAEPYALNLGYPKSTVVVDRDFETRRYLARRKLMLGLAYVQYRYSLGALSHLTKPFQQSMTNNLMLYAEVRRLLGVDITVDSSKSYLKAVGLYSHSPGTVRLILLTRDGRGALLSHLKRKRPRALGVSGWRNYYRRSMPLFAATVENQHILTVRYEDLAGDPRQELKKICAFLGLDFEDTMLDYAAHTHHITNGNNIRFEPTSTIRLDNSWQEKLSGSDRQYFERKAGELNQQLGYQLD